MARTPKKKRGRPPTGIRRPVITLRVHEDIYEAIKTSAERGRLTLSEEAARRIGISVALDKGFDQFLLSQGWTKILDSDGNELLAKGPFAIEKYMAACPRQAQPQTERVFPGAQAMSDIIERLRMPTAYGDDQRREAAAEIERLRSDKDVQRSQDRNAAYEAEIERLQADAQNGNRPLPYQRDELGRMVREAWVRWALTQPNPKASWLVPYDELPERDKEADRQIGEAVARWTLIGDAARRALEPKP